MSIGHWAQTRGLADATLRKPCPSTGRAGSIKGYVTNCDEKLTLGAKADKIWRQSGRQWRLQAVLWAVFDGLASHRKRRKRLSFPMVADFSAVPKKIAFREIRGFHYDRATTVIGKQQSIR